MALIQLQMQNADVKFYPDFFSPEESESFFQDLSESIAWEQPVLKFYGKEVKTPRLVAWYGDVGIQYSYSGITHISQVWTENLLTIKQRIEEVAKVSFNSVLLNLYRDGNDSVGWHSDDEPELGRNPVIDSVSLGSTRTFQFKSKQNPDLKTSIDLTNGSLLIMGGPTQHYWSHAIPKSKTVTTPRINLTFRTIK